MGLAVGLGVFLGIIPGTGTLAAAACATVLRLNLPLTMAGSLLMNPLTSPFFYAGSYFLGDWLWGRWLPKAFLSKVILATFIGNFIVAVSLGLIAYFLTRVVVALRRNRRAAGN